MSPIRFCIAELAAILVAGPEAVMEAKYWISPPGPFPSKRQVLIKRSLDGSVPPPTRQSASDTHPPDPSARHRPPCLPRRRRGGQKATMSARTARRSAGAGQHVSPAPSADASSCAATGASSRLCRRCPFRVAYMRCRCLQEGPVRLLRQARLRGDLSRRCVYALGCGLALQQPAARVPFRVMTTLTCDCVAPA